MNWLADVSLKSFNTFGMDVKAQWLVEVAHEEELYEVIADVRWIKGPRLILGGGSNVLFTQDFQGVVLLNRHLLLYHSRFAVQQPGP